MFISVDLPDPEAPISATISPRSIDSETPLSTGTSISPTWYVLKMFSSRISGMTGIKGLSFAIYLPRGGAKGLVLPVADGSFGSSPKTISVPGFKSPRTISVRAPSVAPISTSTGETSWP